jgi:hypothetical protein
MSEARGREAGTGADDPVALEVATHSAWGEAARTLILDEALARLPEPLRGLLDTPTHRERLREAVLTEAAANASEQAPGNTGGQAASATPREEAAAALEPLATALADGGPDAVFAAAGDLARSAIDFHMPFSHTENSDGALTGNHGVDRAVGVGLVRRYGDVYAEAIRKNRRPVRYLAEPTDRLADWVRAAGERVSPILEADTVARREATYNPAQHPEDLADLDAAAARPYYETLKRELERRGAPEAAALRDAAAHLADLVYTAWVRAAKPLSLHAAARRETDDGSSPYWLLVPAAGMLFILLWPRHRRGAGTE